MTRLGTFSYVIYWAKLESIMNPWREKILAGGFSIE
jgi:hypothetical protein